MIDLQLGSATERPLPDSSCDVVTAVECGFHFHTRERFLAEAYRVLRPVGLIVLADVIRAAPMALPLRRRLPKFSWAGFARTFAVPRANADRRDSYAAKRGLYRLPRHLDRRACLSRLASRAGAGCRLVAAHPVRRAAAVPSPASPRSGDGVWRVRLCAGRGTQGGLSPAVSFQIRARFCRVYNWRLFLFPS